MSKIERKWPANRLVTRRVKAEGFRWNVTAKRHQKPGQTHGKLVVHQIYGDVGTDAARNALADMLYIEAITG
jgi:hypothetical protein